MTTEYERHPLSEVWGNMPDDEFAQLVESVDADGFADPRIIIYEEQVLDGWHRYRAARRLVMLGELDFEAYLGDDPVSFVISRNAHRRHLTKAQIAQIIAKIRPQRSPGGVAGLTQADSYHPDNLSDWSAEVKTQEELADEAGISDRTLRRANVIEDAGLGDDVRSGEITQAEATRRARGDDAKRPPTPMQRLQAKVDALSLEVRQKDDEVEELASRLRFLDGESDPVEAVREELFNSLRAEVRSLRASRDEWMAKHDEELRSRRYWERQAKDLGWRAS